MARPKSDDTTLRTRLEERRDYLKEAEHGAEMQLVGIRNQLLLIEQILNPVAKPTPEPEDTPAPTPPLPPGTI